MAKKKMTKTELASKLGITPQAISMWVKSGEIPSSACMDLEPILKIKARKLFLNPDLLFDMFNNSNKESNTSSIQE